MPDGSWTLSDRQAAAQAIMHLGEDDLRYLNRLIIDRLKLIAQARSTVLLSQFNVGDRVSFPTSSGIHKTGTVQKLNKKTASIVTDDGERWNVAPGLLSPVTDLPSRR